MTRLKLTKRWISKILLSIIIGIFLLGFLIWIISPVLSRHAINQVLQPQNIEVTKNSSLRLNPFTGHLSIRDLQLIKSNENVLSLAKADVEISLTQLLFKTLEIEEFHFDTMFIKIEAINDLVIIAGFDPSKLEEKPEGQSEETPAQEENTNNFKLIAPVLRLKNTKFDIIHEETKHSIFIEKLELENTEGNLESLSSKLNLKAKVNGATLEVNSQLSFSESLTKLNLKLSLDELSLDHYANYLIPTDIEASGIIGLNIDSELSITNNSITVEILPWSFQSKSLAINHELANLSIGKTEISGKPINIFLENNVLSKLNGSLDLQMDKFSLTAAEDQSVLGAWEKLRINEIIFAVNQTNENQEISSSIEKIQFDTLTLSQRHIETKEKTSNSAENLEIPPLVKISTLELNRLGFQKNHLDVNEILLSGIESALLIDETKNLKTLVSPPKNKDENGPQEKTDGINQIPEPIETASTEVDSEQETPFTFNINKIAFQSENKIHIEDTSVSPNYKHTFYIDQLNVQSLSNTNKERSPIDIKGRSNEYAKFAFEGAIAVFSEKPDLKLSGNIDQIDLQEISPYIRDALGFELKNGQLDSRIQVAINQGELDGKVKIFIRGLDTSTANDVDKNILKDQGAIPLNVALGMLKDKKGNIKLDIPLKGSTDDPSFSFNSVVMLVTKKVVLSQAKSYLMKTFVPYANVISVAMAAGEFALKLRFEDLNYNQAQIEIGEEQVNYAQEFIKLMQDKDETQVKICGLATPKEIDLPQGKKIEDEEKVTELRNLAKQRAEAFKRYAVDIGGIDSSRLLLCTPKIDFDKDAKPRISISI